ncbi:hypothetical protein [Ruegeria sp. HKCCD4318-2]|uniref:hypothetical protein n=1 Tax=Ruegeria sp. HKCCD4318-2 TaxID=2683020 RepID=UPI001C0F9C53|nr:hypothetical protein [Ruegeria sp. HKCCD4318-2]
MVRGINAVIRCFAVNGRLVRIAAIRRTMNRKSGECPPGGLNSLPQKNVGAAKASFGLQSGLTETKNPLTKQRVSF